MKLVCNIITPAIENLAEKFGISKEYACTAVSVWQSLNNTSEYPTESQFRKYLQDNKKELESLELAVPIYESHEFEEGKPLTWHENGTIHLRKLPSSNPLEYFFNKYGDEFRKYVRTTEEAYQVMLWNEMYNVQHNTNDNAESKNNALEKAKKYNEKHPLVITDYTQEMQDIKTKAIANGTFMKAPNGNPTNLTERQWLQVRTKAFKDWFGDWEKGLHIEQDDKSYYRGQYEEPIIDKDGNLILRGRKDSLYEKAGYDIEKGVSATTNMQLADEYGANQRGAYEADVEDKYGEFDQSWEKEQELNEIAEHGYYLIQFPKNISNQIINENDEVKIVGDVVIPKGQYIIEHISDDGGELIATADNNASKVVDENGEPLVVYHGTKNNFNIFDKNLLGDNTKAESAKKGFFASSEQHVVYTYGGAPLYYSIYDHPFYGRTVINLEQQYEAGIYTKQEYDKELDELKKDFERDKEGEEDVAFKRLKRLFLNIKNPLVVDNFFTPPTNMYDSGKNSVNISKTIDDAKNQHKDGVIIKGIYDSGKQDDYIFFDSNQAKSATDNVGSFSRENDDIRYNQSFPHPSLVRINKFKDDSPYSKKHANNLQQVETVINALLDANPRHIEVKSVTGEKRRIGINRPFSNRKGTFLLSRGFDLNRPEDTSKDTAYHPLEVRTIVENIFTEAKLKGYIDYNKKLSFRPFMTSKGEMVEVILEDMDDKELEEFEQYAYYIKGSEAADKFKEANAWNKLGEYTDPLLLKKFGNKRIVTVSELLDNLLKFNTKNKELVQLLQSVVGQAGNIELVLTPSYQIGQTLNGNEASAYYSPSANKIYVGSQSNFGGSADNTLLHEIIHALVYNMKKSDAQVQKLTDIYNMAVRLIEKRLGKSVSEIISKENKAEHKVGLNSKRVVKENWLYYGLSNVDEFVSELFTNPAFAHELNKVDEYNEKVGEEQYNIFERFVQWIMDVFKSFFNEEYNSQLFYDAAKAVNDIIINSGTIIGDQNQRVGLSRGNIVYSQEYVDPTKINTNRISNKTADFGVIVTGNSSNFWNEINHNWLEKNPNGIAAYRKRGDKPESFTPKVVKEGWIGNPFSTEGRSKSLSTVQQFYDWLITGNNFDNKYATEELRQAIIQKILSTPKGSPVLYYQDLHAPSHATVIGYLINNKQLLQPSQHSLPESENIQETNIDTLLPPKEFYERTQSPVIPENTKYVSEDDIDTFTDDMFEQDYGDMGLDTLGLPDEASIKKSNEQRSITTEQANNPDNLPKPAPNTGSLNLNVPTEQKKLRSAYDVKTLNYRIEYLTSEFRDNVNIAIDNKLQELADRDSNTNDEAEKASIKKQVDLLNGGDIKDVISIIGFNEIFKMIRTKLQNELNMSEEGSYKNTELAKLLDNLPLLRKDVARQLDAFYGVRLNSNYEVIMSDDELEDEDTNFGDDDEGTRVAGSNDITGTKSRITNPFSTLSKKMKFALSNIMMVDSEGNPVYDDLGNPRYYNPNYLYRMILEESSQWRNADDFCVRTGNNVEDIDIVFINSLAKKHPWAEQLENIFYEDSTMASVFFHASRLDFIHYGTQVEKDGILVSTYENVRPGFEGVYGRALEYYSEGIVLDKDSVYDTIGNIDKKHVDTAQSILEEVDLKQREDEFDTEYINKVYKLLSMLGIKTDKYIVKRLVDDGVENNYEDAVTIVNSIGNIVSNLKEANVEEGSFYHIIDENAADYKILAEKVGMIEETDNVQSFTDAERKKRYSFSTPNYCNTVIKYLTHPEDISRQNYIEEHYKKYEWFFNHTTGEWRTGWLGRLESDPYTRSLLSTYDMVSMDRIPYNEWTPEMMTTGFIREFYKTGWDGNAKVRSFRMPIPADSEVAMFITFEDIVGKDKICKELVNVVMQELYRMSVVESRKKNNASEITNFDSNGSKFNFIPELNDLKVDSEGNIDSNGQKFLDVCLNKSVTERENFILNTITQLEEQKFYAYMNKHFPVTQNGEFVDAGLAGWFAKNGMLKTKDDGSVDYNDFKNLIEHYWYNQIYATTQIVQIYTVDYAYYKDATDFQKRWKEIYASGHKLNTNSTYGKKTRKTVYISDDERTSTIYNEIKQVLDKAVKEGRIQTYDRDNILYKFRNVNTADAQCFVSLNAMKSILDMSTGWTDEMEAAFNRFKNGDWDMSNFNIVWQTLKPFMYTVIDSPDGLGGTMPVPHQNKNSEFLLMAAYTVVANSLQNNPKMVAIQKFMDDNDIDAIQFESAVKVGKQGVINLNYSRDKLDAYKANEKQWEKVNDKALKYLVKQFGEKKALKKFSAMNDYDKYKTYHDALLDEGGISQQEYNKAIKDMEPSMTEVYTILDKECRIQPDEADNASKKIYGVDEDGKPRKAGDLKANVVHELPYEDYMIQQPTPNHLFNNTEAVYGSQMRNLSISDMPDDPDFRVNINGESYTKQEVINLWNSIQIENLLEDYRELEGQIKTIDDFSKELIKMVRNNGKYSADLEEALTVVTNPDGTKGFKIPLTNPVTTLKIQQLALSLFKNRITKQKMRGGGAILVSDFGFTTELQIVRNKKGGVVGLECLLPATSEKFLKPFIKTSKDGTYKYLDINKMPEELRYAIGYRIPTEDKYSIAPLIIKGFLPQQNGSSIMLPMEITTLAGSDFDVDKMFLLLYEFGERKYDIKKAKEDFEKENKLTESLAKIFANETIDLEKVTDIEWKDWWKENKDKYLLEKPQVYKIKYNTEKSSKDNNRKQRNNMLIDIMRGVLATPEIASMIFNPGNFDSLKCAANVLQVAQDKELLEKFMNKYGINSYNNAASALLQIIRTEDLATITDFIKDNSKPIDPLDPDTFIYFHQQNMVGAKLIGVYANNTTLHAKFQRTKLSIHNTDKITNTFIINGRTIDSLHNIDIEMKDGSKIRISKNCSQFSAASVDNVKDPVLAKLLQNGNTAEITCFMLRAGMTLTEISLIATSRIMRDLYLGYNENDIDNYVQTLTAQYNSFENKDPLENLNMHNFTSEEILEVLINNTMHVEPTKNTVKQELMVAKLVQHIIKQAQPFANVTKTGRADSPNGAISHTIAGALLQIEAVRRLEIDDNKTLSGMASGVKNSVITPEMSDESVRKNLLNRPLPHLQAFYSFGIELPMGLLSSYFPQLAPKSLQVIQDIISELPTRALYSEKTRAILDKFFEAETVYGMSDTKMLGDDESQTYFEKLDWYINEFPKWFSKFKTAHPELASMGLFAKMRTENGKVIVKKSGELDQSIRDLYISQMDRLLDGDNLEYLELAKRLFIYSYYTEGLHFGPNSIGQFFSSLFISQFSEAVQSMNDGINKMSEGQIEILNDLFINNNNLYTKIRIPEVKDRNGRVIPDPQSFSIIGKGDNIRYNIKANVVANKYNQRRPVLKYITVRVGNDVLDLKLDRYTSGSEYAIYKPANPIVGPYSIYNDNIEFGKKYEQILKNNQDDVPFAPDEAYYNDFRDSGVDDFAGIDFVSKGKTESNEINCQ